MSGWLWAREIKDGYPAPEGMWEKRPWVNLDDAVWSEEGESAERKVSVKDVLLPTGFGWVFLEGAFNDENSVTVTVPVNSPIQIRAYVEWVDENNNKIQVSKELVHSCEVQQQDPLLTITVSEGKNDQFKRVEVKSDQACKVEYTLFDKHGRKKGNDEIEINKSNLNKNIVLIKRTNELKMEIILKSLGSEVIIRSGSVSLDRGVFVLNRNGWRQK